MVIFFTGHRPQRLGGFDPANEIAAWSRAALTRAVARALATGDVTQWVKYPRLKLVGFLLHQPVPTTTVGLTESPQAFCVSASPAATLNSNRRMPSWSLFRAAFRSRS